MGIEIERKFLLKNDDWRALVVRTSHIAQAYLNTDHQFSTRVRLQSLAGASDSLDLLTSTNAQEIEANLNIKTCEIGMQRSEFTYTIPLLDGQAIFRDSPWRINKKRHYVEYDNMLWEIDEFLDENSGLIVAEVEMESIDQSFKIPDWIGLELTQEQRYYNHALSIHPFSQWVSHIEINTHEQILTAVNANGATLKSYVISTAKNGLGEQKNSYQTPRGLHQVRAKIGAVAPLNSVFKARRLTGEIYTDELGKQYPERDWILSRILWLSGCEKGINRLGQVDTMQRYIYIHGAPENEHEPIGVAHSHGCIRMHSADVIELFDLCFVGTTVLIN